MSYISHFRRQLRLLGISALAAVSSIAPAQVPAKRPDAEDDKDKTTRPFAQDDIIGNEDWKVQGQHHSWKEMDEHIHRHMILEEMVQAEPVGAIFLVQIRYFRESESVGSLRGTRNDGREIVVRRTKLPSETENESFHLLCDDLSRQALSEA